MRPINDKTMSELEPGILDIEELADGKYEGKAGDFYTIKEGQERLHQTELEDCIQEFLKEHPESTGTVKVFVYFKDKISEKRIEYAADSVLDTILEDFSEPYGDPEEFPEPTEAQVAAANEFAKFIASTFPVFSCTLGRVYTINIDSFREEMKPQEDSRDV